MPPLHFLEKSKFKVERSLHMHCMVQGCWPKKVFLCLSNILVPVFASKYWLPVLSVRSCSTWNAAYCGEGVWLFHLCERTVAQKFACACFSSVAKLVATARHPGMHKIMPEAQNKLYTKKCKMTTHLPYGSYSSTK